jgi:hypothetical protein
MLDTKKMDVVEEDNVVLDLAEHEIVANTISLFLIVQSGA